MDIKGVDCDEQLSADEDNKWMELFREMKELNDVTIERYLTPFGTKSKTYLHSEEQYGASLKLKIELNSYFSLSIVST